VANLKIGLIGCGRISQCVHLENLARLPAVEIAALAEVDADRREEAARRAPKAAVFSDYRELLAMRDVQAVVICLPNGLHAEAAVAGFENGKHVYLEKPLATQLTEGQRVVEAWRRSGLIGMIGFNYRFQPLYQRLKAAIEEGRIGQTVSVHTVFSTACRQLPGWKLSREGGGGVLLDLASHHIDLISYLLGQPVREVFARIQRVRSEADTAGLDLRFANGVSANCFFSFTTIDEDRLELYGTAGRLTADRYLSSDLEISDSTRSLARIKKLGYAVGSLIHSPYLFERFRKDPWDPSFRLALTYFVDSVRQRRAAKPDLFDGLRSLAAIEAAEQSAAVGHSIAVSD
jgi:predicted dehydrogenase